MLETSGIRVLGDGVWVFLSCVHKLFCSCNCQKHDVFSVYAASSEVVVSMSKGDFENEHADSGRKGKVFPEIGDEWQALYSTQSISG